MCFAPKMQLPAPMIAATDNREAMAQGRMEQLLRRRRAGAAADVLTSPTGIPTRSSLGGAV